MPVISTLRARRMPIVAPIAIATSSSTMPVQAMLREASPIVATSAITMPPMPKTMPERDVSCLDSPARLMMNSRAATMYAAWAAVSALMPC